MSEFDQPEKPNVLLISVDQWPGLLMRPAGHGVVQTPTLSQIARNGAYFPNAYSACPTCVPARRNMMTSLSSRSHGDRVFSERMLMPEVPTLAECFSRGGYQTFAVGKLHVYPQRNRIGFDDVLLNEEGRHQFGMGMDDYDLFLHEQGYSLSEFSTGMNNNDYLYHPWHLPVECHPTNWTAREMCRNILRRDPTKPGFWFMSFTMPHPPLFPPQEYLDMYRDAEIDMPLTGNWSEDVDSLPSGYKIKRQQYSIADATELEIRNARRAFYASCTHVDHQIRTVIGFLREQGILHNTTVALVSDHGDMLGDHHQWAKSLMLEMSSRIPFIIWPHNNFDGFKSGSVDGRIVELVDVMPTLLSISGLPVPEHCEGLDLTKNVNRDYLYGEHHEGMIASRMVRDARFKLVYTPLNNSRLLFDMDSDPRELNNLAGDPDYAADLELLTGILVENLYGSDLEWVENGKIVGLPDKAVPFVDHRNLTGQRGHRFPWVETRSNW